MPGSVQEIPRSPNETRLRVGSACSGWCSELFALRRLGIPAEASFAAECDAAARLMCQELWGHRFFPTDALDDALLESTPDVDFFCAGPPCQAFSVAGMALGAADARAGLMLQVLLYIARRRPGCFIIENVVGLPLRHGDFYDWMVQYLTDLKDKHGRPAYKVEWTILNARLHSGIPQHRERVFLVGLRRDRQRKPLKWPAEVPMRNLSQYLLPPTLPRSDIDPESLPNATAARNVTEFVRTLCSRGEDPMQPGYVLNVGGTYPHWNKGYCPCITRSRGASRGFYLPWLIRSLSVQEVTMLQGVLPGELPEGLLSDTQLGGLAGNAIPIDLLAAVLRSVLTAAGFL
ncbi:bsp6IM [Symbiodinium necroappetens]|uniref:Bsp6IM protein n=1 Tax=Symbiodinium necroappetens TaxID=1628268 RepID=A0A812ZYV5_9DINO|nr:bsp6IM [Symbiodinium necroappetens]